MNEKSKRLRILLNCSIFAAITAILAQIEIPLPLIPISGQTLAVGIAATVLGSRQGALAMLCYAAIGAVGIPVFAGFSGGPQVLVGPSGGYIFGFIAAAYITGLILEKTTPGTGQNAGILYCHPAAVCRTSRHSADKGRARAV